MVRNVGERNICDFLKSVVIEKDPAGVSKGMNVFLARLMTVLFVGAFGQGVHTFCVVRVKVNREQTFRHIAAHSSLSGLHDAPQNGGFGIANKPL